VSTKLSKEKSSKHSRHKSVMPYHDESLEYEDENSENSRAGTRQAQRCGHGIAETGAKKWKPVNR
jgi:hypothetical protein